MNDAHFPLTPLQHAMVAAWQRAPRAGVDVEQWVVTLRENVDVAALRRAWSQTVAAYGALRTELDLRDPVNPRQKVCPQVADDFSVQDWRETSADQIVARWQTFLEADRREGLDLLRPPLWRVQVIRIAECEYRFVCTYHHVLLDGRSLVLLGRELWSRYDAECRGKTVAPQSEATFAAFVAAWNRINRLNSADYWRATLCDRPAPLLPEPQRVAQETSREVPASAEATATLDSDAVQCLHDAATAADVTLHSLVQAAWSLTLAAFTGEEDHTFGSVRACRKLPVPGIDRMVGMLINTVPFRVQIDRRRTVRSWLTELRNRQLELREHETSPPTDVTRQAGLRADEPLFPTLLMFTDRRPESMLHGDGRPHPTREVRLLERSEFPLALTVAAEAELSLSLEYSVARYEHETARRLLDYVCYYLQTLPTMLDELLADVPSVVPSETETLLHWSRAERNPAIFETIFDRFQRQAANRPDAPAIIADRGTTTYGELLEQSRRSAAALHQLRIHQGDLVGVFCERSPELLALILGIWRRGAVYVPLDPKYPSQRLHGILNDSRPQLIVHDRPLPDGIVPANTQTIELARVTTDATVAASEVDAEKPALDLRAVVLFTSGSTGTPKGAILSHRNLSNHNEHVVRCLKLAPGDRLAPVSSINFDASLEEFFCPLCAGATVVLPEADTLGSFARFIEFIERHKLTILDLPTSLWRELTNFLYETKTEYPASVRLLFMGGEQATRTVYERFLKVGGRRMRWINAYGPTETTIFSTSYEHDPLRDADSVEAPPIGRPIDNTAAYILDRRGRLVPPGVRGELYLGGAGVAEGYLGRPELTAQKFVARPSLDLPEGRYYRTGDVVRWRADGVIDYVGRGDDQIKLRGFRIEPGEIEAAFLRHPAVRDAAVVPQTSPAGTVYLAAYLVLHEGAAWDECVWREFAHHKLPEYMAPQAYVQLEALPQTPNGKVDRRALPEPCLGKPGAQRRRIDDDGELTQVERRVLDVWRETLQLEQLDLHDDFFLAGGDSLRAMALVAKLESALGRPVAPTLLWQARTAAAMAAELTDPAPNEEHAPLILLRDGVRTRPLFFIHSLAGDVWIYSELATALKTTSAVFGIPLQGPDDAMPEADDVVLCGAEYVRRIRAVQPHGPYRIAGYSSGGLLAYEIARQLTGDGEQVEFLGLLDSGVPTPWENRLTASCCDRLKALFGSLTDYFAELRGMGFAERWKRIGRFAQSAARRLFRRKQVAANGDMLDDREILECFAEDISFFPAARLALIKRHYRALDHYDPTALECSAYLFRSTRQPMFAVQTPTMGWEHLIQGPLSVHQVGGSHSELMRGPHVARLAAAMDAALSNLSTTDEALPSTAAEA